MIIYDINSWHYKLILWTWGKHFFEESHVDIKAYMALDSTKLENLTWEEIPKKYTSRTVNFCPYCRAMVGAVITSPLLYLWRLFPHKEKPPRTREEIRKSSARRSLIPLAIGAGINIAFGIKNILFGDLGELSAGIIQIALGALMIAGWKYRERWGKGLIKFVEWIAKHRKPKVKVKKVKVPRPPSKLRAKLAEKHDLYCPPVHFIDKSKDEEHV